MIIVKNIVILIKEESIIVNGSKVVIKHAWNVMIFTILMKIMFASHTPKIVFKFITMELARNAMMNINLQMGNAFQSLVQVIIAPNINTLIIEENGIPNGSKAVEKYASDAMKDIILISGINASKSLNIVVMLQLKEFV